jgi:hypothetical protein
MRTEPSVPHLEVEGIVRMFFADQGSVDDLANSIRITGDRAGDAVLELCEIVKDYFVTGGPFPHRLHAVALAADLVTDLLERIEAYAHGAAAEVVNWDTTKDRGLTPDTRKRFEGILARGERISSRRRDLYQATVELPRDRLRVDDVHGSPGGRGRRVGHTSPGERALNGRRRR